MVSMYTNIDLDHAIQIIQDWMKIFPENFHDQEYNGHPNKQS